MLSLSTGSIFVDCGSTVNYVDNITGIPWKPDDKFFDEDAGVNVGVNADVPPYATQHYPHFSELRTVRYFPDHRIKNCYKFPVMANTTYQLRGTFFYGDYDNQSTVPSFEMAVDGTIVASNFTTEANKMVYQEVTYVAQTNFTFLCLLRDATNTNPFISAISLVNVFATPDMVDNIYERYYYLTQFRWNFGGNAIIRYVS